jgi:hypothetical protein
MGGKMSSQLKVLSFCKGEEILTLLQMTKRRKEKQKEVALFK